MTMMVAVLLLLCSGTAVWATNIQFSRGPEIVEREIGDNTIIVRFSLGWDNSWNLNSPPNHDAAWIFMKYRKLGHDGFHHANLHQVEQIVMGTDGNGAGSTRHNVEYGMSPIPHRHDAAVGVFLSRSDISVGSNVFENVELHWDIEHTGIDENTVLSVRVFAIEMVFIPPGQFRTGLTTAAPHTDFTTGQPITGAAMHPNWPLGNNPFYIMKHEVTQHAWVDFLNSLTLEQQMARSFVDLTTAVIGTRFANRPGTIVAGGHTITQSPLTNSRMFIQVRQPAVGNRPAVFGLHAETTGAGHWDHEQQGGNLPMFGLNWHDVMAYLDWAGLRPLTEFEYEKAARGTLQVINNELAWGNADIGIAVMSFDDRNRATEVSGTSGAIRATPNADGVASPAHNATSMSRWPIRVGAFARDNTSRVDAGASFWGVMNMSDNVPERFVRFDVEAGRLFRGTHGDGNLTGDGFANVECWPSVNSRVFTTANNTGAATSVGSQGTIFRGIGLSDHQNIPAFTAAAFGVGARAHIHSHGSRDPWTGARGGRSVPIEFAVLAHPNTDNRGAILNGVGATTSANFAEAHRLRISVVGGYAFNIQWYWTEDPDAVVNGAVTGGTPVSLGQGAGADGRGLTYLPPNNEAHGPRFFFARITDDEGAQVTTNLSGSFSVMGVETQPSTAPLTITTLASGTSPLRVQPVGGTPPFEVQWHVVEGTTTGQAGAVGHIVSNFTLWDTTFLPIIPIPGRNWVFYASIRCQTGAIVRTHFSGVHLAQSGQVWLGNSAGTTVGGTGSAQPTPGATGQIHSITLQPGVYRLEAWGGQGGRGFRSSVIAHTGQWATGGYTQLYYRVTEPTTIYIVPGGSGSNSSWQPFGHIVPGGFNGGGAGGHALVGANGANPTAANARGGGSGGGASHISLRSGTLDNQAVRDHIIIVAGGGGGGGASCACCSSGRRGGNLTTEQGPWGANVSIIPAGQALNNALPTWSTPAANIISAVQPGSPGRGGNGIRTNINTHGSVGAGGGGGWFGGSGSAVSGATTAGGGGGSGHVNPALTHDAQGLSRAAPFVSHNGHTVFGSAATNVPTGGIEQPGANAPANTPRHPGTIAPNPTTAQSNTNIMGGAVRIIRVQ